MPIDISGFSFLRAAIVLPALAWLISAAAVWLSIRYAHARRLIDQPGQRRSHTIPTPRGGGIGIVIAVLLCFCLPMLFSSQQSSRIFGCSVAIALVMVATIGWIDDHRPLSARFRIVVHFLAALVLLILPLLFMPKTAPAGGFDFDMTLALIAACLIAILATLIVWSINLHNFMDGINGLLACQAIFVFVALALACVSAGRTAVAWQLFVLAAATLGFLPFNFPRARIFMGDVGSGALGLLIAIALWLAAGSAHLAPFTGVIACSAFVTDATCTLLSRMLRGRRWYSAHREHLYQWMARTGMSHARVVACYMAWNICVVAPLVLWVNRPPSMSHGYANATDNLGVAALRDVEILQQLNDPGQIEAVIVYALAIALWIFGKRWCLHKMKSSQHRHATA
ncbi:glycosyltransferase family 4 protein [Pseudolysobacter antarcticus]|uniref:Glycosyltransferase family 4 protein n=1 Tax=Pseudolysobacter antarcticus TaxID=2511995 RepID=A0A411HIM4_9GAMM|nr:glycosyltransferase family 4 protein [Pseudolysobacter antarcticus]QBB70355.1 glycosyltransferase family 4 protein [Pseudolysobacter antarcticus]